ncbi:MAG: hypothetical protein J6Y46_01590 [Prevotella sp.]|jgi:hypothetical protein|nr:hypothetical protein [Prevotella sp.]
MNSETIQFLLTTLMELATLVCAYLGLRLIKWSWQRRALIIGIPLVANIILYLVYRTTPFFYLAVVLVICIPFVWPRKSA